MSQEERRKRYEAYKKRLQESGKQGERYVQDSPENDVDHRQQLADEATSSIFENLATGAKEAVIDSLVSGAQSMTLEFGDEIYGGIAAAIKSATGDDRSITDIYMDMRDDARSFVSSSRSRSPYATFVADFLAPNPLAGVNKLKKLGQLTSGVISGAATGLGASAGDIQTDLSAALVGAGLGTSGAALSGIGKKIAGDKGALRARALGLKGDPTPGPDNFISTDRKIDTITDSLQDMGLFNKGGKNFNIETGKFDDVRTGLTARTADAKTMAIRMSDAIKKSSEDTADILSKFRIPIDKDGNLAKKLYAQEMKSGKFWRFSEKNTVKLDDAVERWADQNSLPRTRDMAESVYERRNAQHLADLAESSDRIWPFTKSSFRDAQDGVWQELEDKLISRTDLDSDKVEQLMEESLSRVSAKGYVTPTMMQKEKQNLYKIIDNNFGKENFGETDKVVMKTLANHYKQMIETVVEKSSHQGLIDPKAGGRLLRNNQNVSEMMFFRDAIYSKALGEKLATDVIQGRQRAAVAAFSPGARTLGIAESVLDAGQLKRAELGDIPRNLEAIRSAKLKDSQGIDSMMKMVSKKAGVLALDRIVNDFGRKSLARGIEPRVETIEKNRNDRIRRARRK
jgi:hypothetical protein